MNMSQKVDTRQISYTGYAPQYDAGRIEGPVNSYVERIRLNALLRAIGQHDLDRRILDVGCGTGRGPVALATSGFTNITALDFTPAMLERATEKIARLEEPRSIRLIRGDAYALPFPDASFEVVVSLRFVHMFRFSLQLELIREMARVCKPGGLVAVELESIHKGLFVTRYLEQRRVASHQKFNSMFEIRKMFDSRLFTHKHVIGAVLPKAYKVFQHWPALGERVESVAFYPPFNWLAAELIVSGRRR